MKFMDANDEWAYTMPSAYDSTMTTIDTSHSSLESFFSRPQRIADYTWTIGALFYETFDPWTLFWQDPKNVERIANYNLLRCKMKVSLKINGNAFYYGRIMASYVPLQGTNPIDDMTVDRAFFTQDIVAASQRPHVLLDPTTNSGGTLTLPFFWQYNYLNVPESLWTRMGRIILHQMNPLDNANSATGSVNISIYAWAEDLEFGIPTYGVPAAYSGQCDTEYEPQMAKGKKKKSGNNKKSSNDSMVTQPGNTNDEYEKSAGVLSGPMDTVAKISGMLEMAPIIGPYAKATSMVSSHIASIARVFGYSRPVQAEGAEFYRPIATGNMANTNVVDNSTKLALDIKQETTVDSRIAGLDGTDELGIKSLATRESYVTLFPWTITDNVDDVLFRIACTSSMFNTLTTGGPQELHMTPSCFVGSLFEFWHGTMEVRFQFVCSAYHKGRVRISFDPTRDVFIPDQENVNFSTIVDLAETRDVTIQVPWSKESHWAQSAVTLTDVTLPYTYGTSAPPLTFPATTNGYLTVSIINELTFPNDFIAANIQVNVFTRMCDDFEVMSPTSSVISDLTYFPQFDTEYENQADDDLDEGEEQEFSDDDDDNAPIGLKTTELADIKYQDPKFFDIYPGEVVTSLRSLLKRYNYHRSWGNITGARTRVRITLPNFPFYRGDPPGAIDTNATGTYNYCANTFLNYITPAFSGVRGGLRWKYIMESNRDDSSNNIMHVSRLANGTNQYQYTENPAVSTTSNEIIAVGGLTTQFPVFGIHNNNLSMDGLVLQRNSMGALEAEFPFYAKERFYAAKTGNKTTTNENVDFHSLYFTGTDPDADRFCVHSYCAAAEDFNLFFFSGIPRQFVLADPAI